LVAENYDREVIYTADWLNSQQHAVDIQCYAVQAISSTGRKPYRTSRLRSGGRKH